MNPRKELVGKLYDSLWSYLDFPSAALSTQIYRSTMATLLPLRGDFLLLEMLALIDVPLSFTVYHGATLLLEAVDTILGL